MPEPKRPIAAIIASVAILLLMAAGAAAMRGTTWLPANVCLSCDDLPSLTPAEPPRTVASNGPLAHSEHTSGAVHQSERHDGDADAVMAPMAMEAHGRAGAAGEGDQGNHDWTSHSSTPLIRGAANNSHSQGPRSAGGSVGGMMSGGASARNTATTSAHSAQTPADETRAPVTTPAPARPTAPPSGGSSPAAPRPPSAAPPAAPAAAGAVAVAIPVAPALGPLSDDPDPFLPAVGAGASTAPSVAAVAASATPEPASLFLLGTGIFGVWTAARRRR